MTEAEVFHGFCSCHSRFIYTSHVIECRSPREQLVVVRAYCGEVQLMYGKSHHMTALLCHHVKALSDAHHMRHRYVSRQDPSWVTLTCIGNLSS